MDTFTQFGKELRKAVGKRFSKPTPIQQKVIPEILKKKNCLVISETGSGKTESALLPVFHQFLEKRPQQISILYITPLKSLNRDLLKRILWWANTLEFEVGVRHGDTTQYERGMQAQNPPDMLISTPETVQAMLTGKNMREHLSGVQWIIVDEVHELIDNKRGAQLAIGLERVKEIAQVKQIIGLSATVGSPETVSQFLTGGKSCRIIHAEKTKKIQIRVEYPAVSGSHKADAQHTLLPAETNARLQRIAEEIEKQKALLVFTNTRESAEVLSSRLKALGDVPVETHHSSLSKESRIAAEQEFRDEKIQALICTSSLELGIDIGAIDVVLQYQSPRQVTKLMQRVGRAGHSLSQVSKGIIIAGGIDDCFESAVIAQMGLSGWIEETRMYENALDVVGNQISGLTMEYYQLPLEKAYQIITRAYPFRKLSREKFMEVARLMEKLGYIWVNEEDELMIRRRRRGFDYFYKHLSTIPDTKNYKVRDVITNTIVGTLDAEFIALHGTAGATFIVKGVPWTIIEYHRDEVLVEPARGLAGAIPAWQGELIPVPEAVSQRVGKLREQAEKQSIDELMKQYPIDLPLAKKLKELVKQQKKAGYVPGSKDVIVEYERVNTEEFSGTIVVVHSCFGSLVNETLGNVIATLLMPKLGSIGLKTDPYRIVLKIQKKEGEQDVAELLKQLNQETIVKAVQDAVPGTQLFSWRFVHVAQRFGVIAKDADFGKGYIRKIIQLFKGTPVYEEAMNEVVQDKLDVEGAVRVAEDIQSGKLNLSVKQRVSVLGNLALDNRYDIVAAEKPDTEIFEIFKKRVMDSRAGLICTHCGYLLGAFRIDRLPSLRCPKCEAKRVGKVPERYMMEAKALFQKYLAGKKLNEQEEKWVNITEKTADLITVHGEDAVIVLSGRGIGPATASRVLNRVKGRVKGGDVLFFELLQAEKNYAKTRRFWQY